VESTQPGATLRVCCIMHSFFTAGKFTIKALLGVCVEKNGGASASGSWSSSE
jgi:hypothetical protein